MHANKSTIFNIANIAAPTAPADTAANEVSDTALFERLRDFARKCDVGKNDNETVIALIHVCIAEGLDTRRRMVGALTRLGFKHSHVAIMLEKGCRSKMWRLDSGDRYSVID